MSRQAEHEVDVYAVNVYSKENIILLKCFISNRKLMLITL